MQSSSATAPSNGRDLADGQARLIVDSAVNYAIVGLDRAGVITSWNVGAERVMGWLAADAIGRPASLFFTPEDVEADIQGAELRSAAEDGRGVDERWHLRRDGSRFWANGELMPLRRDKGELEGYVKILRDRTEQHSAAMSLSASEVRRRSSEEELREANLALRASELRLAALVSASSEVRYSMNADWSKMRQLAGGGFLADTASADPNWLAEYIHPDDQPAVLAAIEQAIRAKGPF